MKLQTQVPVTKGPRPISYESRLLLMGSCFVTHTGRKLAYYHLDSVQNPFGILYHPLAIQNLIHRAARQIYFEESELFFHNEGWHSYEVHSELSHPSQKDLLAALNRAIRETHNALQNGTHLLITLGSAWVYRLKSNGMPVANCHKVPQREFEKQLLSIDEIAGSLRQLLAEIQALNEGLHCIFTISPVRHLKDGFSGNLRSKAHLISALFRVLEETPNPSALSYFPAYEIVMDELRDYRFYDMDLLHPNATATAYVWEKFRSAWIAEAAYPVMEEVEVVQKGLQHRPFNPDSEAYREFRTTLEAKMAYLEARYPSIRFTS